MTYIAHVTTVHHRNDTRIKIKEVTYLARALDARVALFVQDAPIGEREACDGFEIVSSGPKLPRQRHRISIGLFRMLKLILREKPDIVHFHDPELIPVCFLLKLLGYKVIYDVHEEYPKQLLSSNKGRIFKAIVPRLLVPFEWLSSKLFDGIVVATPAIGQNFKSKNRILVQNYPITTELLFDDALRYQDRPKNFVYVGGITKIRGTVEMVTALDLVDHDSVQLLLAGNIPVVKHQRELEDIPGWKRVDYTGWADRSIMSELLNKSRAGLVLFHPEPNHIAAQPNKLFEYMGTGLPVIASDFPLWRSIVDGAGCGILVDPMNPQAIADAMDWILENPDEAEAMGKRGQEAVLTTYNWDTEAEKLLTFYQQRFDVDKTKTDVG